MSNSYNSSRNKNLNYNYYSRKGNEPFYDSYTGELVNEDDFEDVDEYDDYIDTSYSESDFSDADHYDVEDMDFSDASEELPNSYYDSEEDKIYSDDEFEDIEDLDESNNYGLPFQYRNKLSHDYIRNKYNSYVDSNKEHFLSKYI